MKYGFIFGDLKKILISRYGKDAEKQITADAEKEYKRIVREFPDVKGDGQFMLPFAAYYIALKSHDPEKALPLLCKYGSHMGKKFQKIMHAVTSVPGVSKSIWKNINSLLIKMSSEEKGYKGELFDDKNGTFGVDIFSCPLNEAAIKIGIPEAAKIVCAMDKEYMNGFKYIDYTRSSSVAEGGKCCDYRLRFDKNKK